jgi:hypothetical protein
MMFQLIFTRYEKMGSKYVYGVPKKIAGLNK